MISNNTSSGQPSLVVDGHEVHVTKYPTHWFCSVVVDGTTRHAKYPSNAVNLPELIKHDLITN